MRLRSEEHKPVDMLMDARLVEKARTLTLPAFVLRPESRHILVIRIPFREPGLIDELRRAFGRGVPSDSQRPAVVDLQTARTELLDVTSSMANAIFGERELEEWIAGGQCFPAPLIERGVETDGVITVGRSRTSDLCLRSRGISKQHAAFEVDGERRLWLGDTGSRNGTFVDGERLGPGDRVEITRGREIRFGTVEAIYCPPDLFWLVAQLS